MSEIKVIMDKNDLDVIGNAVRGVNGETDKYPVNELFNKIVDGVKNVSANNIKRGVEIFGVKGNYNGPASNTGTVSETVEIVVNGDDYTVDGLAQKGLYKAQYSLGTTVQLEYTGQGQFLHWVNNDGKVQGGGATACSVQLNKDMVLSAVTVSDALPGEQAPYSAYVEFMSEYNQIMGAGTWGSADSAEQHELPKIPFKVGSKGIGWTLDGQTACTVQNILNTIDGSFAYREIRSLYEDVIVPITVNVVNNVDDTVTVIQGTRGKYIQLIEEVKEGYKLAYWSQDAEGNEKMGRNYASAKDLVYCYAYPTHDTTIYAHYVPQEQNTPEISAIVIAGSYPAMLDSGPHILSVASRNICSTDTVKAHGLLTAKSGNIQEETAEQTLVIGSTVANVITADSTGRAGSYTLRTQMETEDTVLWVRAYCIVTDSTGAERTIYSAVHSYTYNELMAIEPSSNE